MIVFIEDFVKACEKYSIGPWKITSCNTGSLAELEIGESTTICVLMDNRGSIMLNGTKLLFAQLTAQQYADKVRDLVDPLWDTEKYKDFLDNIPKL